MKHLGVLDKVMFTFVIYTSLFFITFVNNAAVDKQDSAEAVVAFTYELDLDGDDSDFMRTSPVIMSNVDALTALQNSSFDVVTSQIDTIIILNESCCSGTTSGFDSMSSSFDAIGSDLDALSAFDQTCCVNTTSALTALGSDIDALTRLQGSGFDVATSSINYVRSDIDALSTFEQSCCTYTNSSLAAMAALQQSCCVATNTSLTAVVSSQVNALSVFDQTCCVNTTSALTALGSDIDALTRLQGSGFDVATSSINYVRSDIDALSSFEQSCCTYTNSSINALQSLFCSPTIITSLPYTISTPGAYQICSNLSYSGTGTGITVSASNVVLDLKGRTITLTGVGAVGINFSSQTNIEIKDGAINGSGVASTLALGTNASFVRLEGLDFFSPAASGIAIKLDGTANQNFFLYDIMMKLTNNLSTGIYFSGGQIDINMREISINMGTTTSTGIFIDSNADDVLMYDVLLDGGSIGCYIGLAEEVSARELVISDASTAGLKIAGLVGGLFTNLNTARNTVGVQIDGTTRASSSIVFQNCISVSNTSDGFQLIGGLASNNIMFRSCSSLLNAGHGYSLNASAAIRTMTYDNCIASNNTLNGFNITNFATNTFYRYCISQSNTNGFFIGSTNAVSTEVVQCYANDNTGTGISNSGTTSFIFGNACNGNGTNYSAGIANGNVTGATYWTNVR